MNIHNQLEDMVLKKVNEIFTEEEAGQSMHFCTCHQCRLDVACYVLNRITPLYTVSGRGLAHLESDYQDKLQREADIVSLIKKGIVHVSNASGVYSFWPYPESADAKGLERDFELELAVDDPAFAPLRHYIKITVISSNEFLQYKSGSRIYNVDDLYLVPAK